MTEQGVGPSPKTLGTALVTPLPDPPAPADPQDPLVAVRIQGIMDMGGKRVALINDNIYEEGQTIYGKVITHITLDGVTVMDGTQERVFPVDPSKK